VFAFALRKKYEASVRTVESEWRSESEMRLLIGSRIAKTGMIVPNRDT